MPQTLSSYSVSLEFVLSLHFDKIKCLFSQSICLILPFNLTEELSILQEVELIAYKQ